MHCTQVQSFVKCFEREELPLWHIFDAYLWLYFTGINIKSVTSHLNNANCNRVSYSSSRECVIFDINLGNEQAHSCLYLIHACYFFESNSLWKCEF